MSNFKGWTAWNTFYTLAVRGINLSSMMRLRYIEFKHLLYRLQAMSGGCTLQKCKILSNNGPGKKDGSSEKCSSPLGPNAA